MTNRTLESRPAVEDHDCDHSMFRTGTWGQTVYFLHIRQLSFEIDLEVFQQTVAEIENPSMNDRVLILLVALLDSRSLDDVPTGFHHIEFNQTIVSRVLLGDSVEFLLVQAINVADVSEPWVKQTQVSRCQGRLNPSTVVVAAHDDVLDLQVPHSIVDHGHDVEVDIGHQIGDITVNEDLASLQAHNLVGGDTAIATSDVPDCR